MIKSPEEMRTWYKEAGYGMMIHWGLYSLLGGEWNNTRIRCEYAEWAMANLAIPVREYEKLASAFNPIFFNAEEWVKCALDSGMKYMVVTSKHHDGFALFHSRVDKYNVVDATPFGRDIIGELSEACYKYGLKFGLYYSQDLDWHEKNGGGYLSDHIPCSGVTWCNSWDFTDKAGKNFSECFERKIYPQVEEILTNYGDLCLIWFDVPMTISNDESRRLFDLVKKHQPNCLINSRLGNGAYDYVSLGDNEIPDHRPDDINAPQSADMNDICGFKPSPYGLYETAATLNNTWGFCSFDHNWKSPETVAAYRKKLNDLGINYLLNVGPDALGRFPVKSTEILREAERIYRGL